MPHRKRGDPVGEFDHHFRRFTAIGHARRVAKVNEVAVGHTAAQGLQYGESSDSGIEHADGVANCGWQHRHCP